MRKATLALLTVAVLLAIATPALADDLASPSPTPTTTTTPRPSATFVVWALRWRASDVRARRAVNPWRAAFLLAPLSRVTPAPARSASSATWLTAVRLWRSQARARFAAAERFRYRATHPGGSGASRWLPLARYVGWPRAEEGRLVLCMTGESGGDPWATNGICDGLMQINRCHHVANVFNPLVNLAAGLRLWWADRARGGSGWRAWTVMWRYW